MADFSALRTDLTETSGTEVARVYRDGGRAFSEAVSFERADAELVFERLGHTVG